MATKAKRVDIDEIKKHLRSFFTDGSVLIVEFGISCAEGLPSMATP